MNNKLINDYLSAAFLTPEIAKNMVTRLEWMTMEPQHIVDLGCGVGQGAELLRKHYKSSQIIAIDHAEMLLRYGQKKIKDVKWLCAEVDILPVADHSVDLVFANLLLPWFDDFKTVLQECKRILRPHGLFIFSSLGPDTLVELHNDFSDKILPNLLDMHDVGDALVQTGFVDPVLDVELLTITYRELKTLLAELQLTGMLTNDVGRIDLEPNQEGVFPVTYEIVYGHAWTIAEQKKNEEGIIKIPLTHLKGRKKQK